MSAGAGCTPRRGRGGGHSAGRLNPGDNLPSIAQLCEHYKVGASTIQQVYIRLEALEVIDRRQGKGVFVTDPATWSRKP
ncbi:winged helix-turn-helix domain-containing protein [Micromonospora echinospora]